MDKATLRFYWTDATLNSVLSKYYGNQNNKSATCYDSRLHILTLTSVSLSENEGKCLKYNC